MGACKKEWGGGGGGLGGKKREERRVSNTKRKIYLGCAREGRAPGGRGGLRKVESLIEKEEAGPPPHKKKSPAPPLGGKSVRYRKGRGEEKKITAHAPTVVGKGGQKHRSERWSSSPYRQPC